MANTHSHIYLAEICEQAANILQPFMGSSIHIAITVTLRFFNFHLHYLKNCIFVIKTVSICALLIVFVRLATRMLAGVACAWFQLSRVQYFNIGILI